MKRITIENDAGWTDTILEEDLPKAYKAAEYLRDAALKLGETREEAEKHMIRIVKVEEYDPK